MYLTPRVIEVKALENKLIYIKFEDGKEKIYSMAELIEKIEFYKYLKDEEYFKKVVPSGCTVEWPNGEDVCPENLYYDSEDYNSFYKK